jgi:uncharacterized surface protein with fasciclin (FAS1) repeats
MNKPKAIIMSMALLLAAPATAHASTLNGKKCDTPGAMQRANNSRFVCSPEDGRNVWRRINGQASIGTVINVLPGYSLLNTALKQAGLDTVLSTGGPYTLFAPRNAAFLALPKSTLDYLLDPANVTVLRKVLLNHVFASSVRSDVISTGGYNTLNGTAIDVMVRRSGIRVDGAKVTFGDLIATNGVIHGVSKVLVPADVVINP